MNTIQWTASIMGLGLIACASAPPPHEREASSEAAIRAAKEVGATQVPQASLHLKLAQEQLDKGKAQMKNGDNDEAAYTLLRAQADAELSLALARESKTRIDAQQVMDKVRALRGERPAAAVQPQTGQ
jgi:hypothetical protein